MAHVWTWDMVSCVLKNLDIKVNIERLCANISQLFAASHRGFTQFPTFQSSPISRLSISLSIHDGLMTIFIRSTVNACPLPRPKSDWTRRCDFANMLLNVRFRAGQECQLDVGWPNQTSNVCRQVVIPTWFEQVAEHPSRRHSTFDKFVTSLRKFVDCCWHICHKRGSESVDRTIAFSRVLLWHQHFVRRLDVLSKYTRQTSIFNYWIDGWKIYIFR